MHYRSATEALTALQSHGNRTATAFQSLHKLSKNEALPFRNRCATAPLSLSCVAQPLCYRFTIVAQPLRYRFTIVAQPLCHRGVALPFRNRFESALQSLRIHFTFAAQPLRND
jgi:hypothetical protein